jgi:tetratricopeptide (TPR) repeat protein/DNA-binding SARP family transcriptional activator
MLPRLFALFVVSPGHRVERDEIAYHLWPNGGASVGRISRHLSDLRDRLDGRVGRLGSGGCSMDLTDSHVDLLHFRDEVQRSRDLSPFARFDVLRGVLERWLPDGPLRGLPGAGFQLRRAELLTERSGAVVTCVAAAWDAGEHEWLLKETEEFLERFPVDKKSDEQVFRYRLLATIERSLRAAKQLIKERKKTCGAPIDPELAQLFREISRNSHQAGRPRTGTLSQPIPRQLPFPERALHGRSADLASMCRYLAQCRAEGRPALILLTGLAGVGKSALATRLCRMVETEFPDGTLYANLYGFAGEGVAPAEPGQVLRRFLSDMGVRAEAADLDALSSTLRTRLASRSLIMVLDDAAHVDQVLPLLPGAGTSAVIITSRYLLPDLSADKDVRVCSLEPLDRESAAEVLYAEMAPGVRNKCEAAVDRLVDLCGRLPLALSLIAGRVRNRPPQGVAELVTLLGKDHQRLRELHEPGRSLSMQLALGCSVRALSPGARWLLWQLAVHPGPSIDWDAAMDLGAVGPGHRTERFLTELIEANLVEFAAYRYRLHDLVRAYARHEVLPNDGEPLEELRERTVRQVLEHQLHNVAACDRVIDPQRTLPIADPGVLRVVEPDTEERAMSYLDAEYETVLRGIDLAAQHDLGQYVWLTSMALVSYQWRRGRHAEAERLLRGALEASRELATPTQQAMVYRMLAGSQIRSGSFELGLRNVEAAVRISSGRDDSSSRLSLALSLHMRAVGHERRGDLQAAEDDHRRALRLFDAVSNSAGVAAALNGIGTVRHARGEHDEALRHCGEALRIFETTDDANGRANALTTLAGIHASRSEREEALRLYERAARIYQGLSYWPNEAKVRFRIAGIQLSAGHTDAAVEALERVVVLREFMGDDTGVREVLEQLESLR